MIRRRNSVDSEIRQADSADIRYAGFAQRLKAFAFDFIPILAYIIFLFGVMMAMITPIPAIDTIGMARSSQGTLPCRK